MMIKNLNFISNVQEEDGSKGRPLSLFAQRLPCGASEAYRTIGELQRQGMFSVYLQKVFGRPWPWGLCYSLSTSIEPGVCAVGLKMCSVPSSDSTGTFSQKPWAKSSLQSLSSKSYHFKLISNKT